MVRAVLEKPTDVKVELTDKDDVYNVSWKMLETPALKYFKVRYGDNWHYTFTDAIPAANRSTIISVTKRDPGTIVEFYVYPFTAFAEIGNHSDPASFVVPGGALTFVLFVFIVIVETCNINCIHLLRLFRTYVANHKAFRNGPKSLHPKLQLQTQDG